MKKLLILLPALLILSPDLARAAAMTATGITEPVSDVMLSAAVSGIVRSVKYKEGDFVESGAVILELDNHLEQLEAERRQLALANKRADWEALRQLSEKDSISVKKEELEQAETDYKIADVEYKMAMEQLRQKSITAPCAGYISEIVRDPGEAAEEYQPVVRLVDTRQCYFTSNIEAQTVRRLKLGQTMTLEIDGADQPVEVTGKIIFLSPVVDPASGLQKVKVLFDNSQAKIAPGVTGRILIP